MKAPSYDAVVSGDILNGVHRDPVSYLIAGLPQYFAQMDEEMRMATVIGQSDKFWALSARREHELTVGSLRNCV